MCKILTMKKVKIYDNVNKTCYIYSAQIVNSTPEVMAELPIFVELNLSCQCDNMVETQVIVKTSKKIYKIIRNLNINTETVDTDMCCPVCCEDMVIDDIEIVAEESDN